MFHHHLLSLDENETLRKIYEKQKNNPTKGDWFCMLQEDFTFIGEAMNEDMILSMSKSDYKTKVNQLGQKEDRLGARLKRLAETALASCIHFDEVLGWEGWC